MRAVWGDARFLSCFADPIEDVLGRKRPPLESVAEADGVPSGRDGVAHVLDGSRRALGRRNERQTDQDDRE
jgi:hypothetical protein